jgi:low temperature requirement protein LtrA
MSHTDVWDYSVLSALLATFLGTLAMWWLYFGTSSRDATYAITHSDDPGRIGAYFHYIHAILVAGIIATAVGNDLVMSHPHDAPTVAFALTLSGGPAIFLLGSAVYKKVVYGKMRASHVAGFAALLILIPIAPIVDLLTMGWLTTMIMLVVSLWESLVIRRRNEQDKSGALTH